MYVRRITLVVPWVVLLLVPAVLSPAEEARRSRPKKVRLAGIPGSLEEMLGVALRSNPDIAVAEATVRQAEAKLRKARFKAAQDIASAYQEIEVQKGAVRAAEEQYESYKRLWEMGRATQAETILSLQAITAARSSLARAEAQIRYILGSDGKPVTGEMSLEKMLSRAVQSSPDVSMAEADVHLAQVRLRQSRLGVTRDVTAAHEARRAQQAALEAARSRFERVLKLKQQNVVSEESEFEAVQALIEAEASIVQADAHVRYLLGLGIEPSRETDSKE